MTAKGSVEYIMIILAGESRQGLHVGNPGKVFAGMLKFTMSDVRYAVPLLIPMLIFGYVGKCWKIVI